MVPALALPTGLPDAGFCSTDQPASGVGSTLQTNAINQLFAPNLRARCAAANFTWGGGGSGAGVAAVTNLQTLVGGTDDPITPQQQQAIISAGHNSPIHSIPVLVSPVAVVYNLPCAAGQTLTLSSINLAKMYDGVIKTWDHKLLSKDNKFLKTSCAGVPINLVARADVSGTTFLFKDYLSKRNSEYVALEQPSQNQSWLGSIACAGNGSGGVVNCVKTTANSVGYVAYSNAVSGGLSRAQVDNPAHQFSSPDPAACTLAATTAAPPGSTLSNWSQVSFTDSALGYPICGLTYDLVFQNTFTAYSGAFSEGQVRDVVDYLSTALDSGVQAQLPSYGYGALPAKTFLKVARVGVGQISYN